MTAVHHNPPPIPHSFLPSTAPPFSLSPPSPSTAPSLPPSPSILPLSLPSLTLSPTIVKCSKCEDLGLGARQNNILGSVRVRLCLRFTIVSLHHHRPGQHRARRNGSFCLCPPGGRGKGVHPGTREDEFTTNVKDCSITFEMMPHPPPSLSLTMARFSP